MDLRCEQRLVRVDVADACNDALIEDRGLHGRLPAPEGACQVGGHPPVERLGPELAGEPGLRTVLCDAPGAEAARVGVGQIGAVVEQRPRAQEARVILGRRREPQQVPGHAQVHEQRGAVVELGDEVLAAAAERLDADALQAGGDGLGRLGIGQPVVEYLYLGERSPAEVREQPAPDRLDLGQLGHQPIVSSRSGGYSTAAPTISNAASTSATARSACAASRACTCASGSPASTSSPGLEWTTMPTAWSMGSSLRSRPAPRRMAARPIGSAPQRRTEPACGAATATITGAVSSTSHGRAASRGSPPWASTRRSSARRASPDETATSASLRPSKRSTPRSEST